MAGKVLMRLGVDLDQARQAVENTVGYGDRVVYGEIGLTSRAKKAIELAVDEARRLNHHFLGTEHLLLGPVREGGGIGAGVLESLGPQLAGGAIERAPGPQSIGEANAGVLLVV